MWWVEKYQTEIARAKKARLAGNEGMARVCARRAAGAIISECLRRNGDVLPSENAYNLTRFLSDQDNISPEIKIICENLLLRVTPEHQLPAEADLIKDVERLKEILLG